MRFTPNWRAMSLAALCALTLSSPLGVEPAYATDGKDQAPAVAQPEAPAKVSGIDKADLDTAVSPAKDFFDYATGGWRAAHPIPGDEARWGTFNILADTNTKACHNLLVRASISPSDDLERKLGNLYYSGMDEKLINAVGITPIRPEMSSIVAVENPEDLAKCVSLLHQQNIFPFFEFCSTQDDKDSSRMIGLIWQSGLGLPERDYYLRSDAESRKLLAAYRTHIENMFVLFGDSPAASKREAQAVLTIETKLARASLPAAELRDPQKVYHLMKVSELNSLTPGFDWKAYFREMGVENLNELNVGIPSFLKDSLKQMCDASKLEDNRSYMRWNLLNAAAPYLAEDFEKEHFNFYSTTMRGIKEMKPRWKRVVDTIGSSYANQGLGQLYVKNNFSPEAKAKVQEMVNNILEAMATDIPQLTWMSPETQKAALAKLHSFTAKIGYPDVPRDYSDLRIYRSRYYDNIRNCRIAAVKHDLAKIGKPVDPNEWYMPAQMVNAYYSPNRNEIVFPAGILQPPFFNPQADDAVNYGGIGMVIGHEISHGFDDQGSQYDGQGNLRNWWTDADRAAFEKLAKGVEDQFAGYTVNGIHLNGKLVLGESMADVSGLALAWMAYQRALEKNPSQDMDGFTPAQRFFLGYAKVWAVNMRPEMEKQQVYTDPHPHARWRVNGPVSNMPEFFKAFNVKDGDPMCRPADKRNKVW